MTMVAAAVTPQDLPTNASQGDVGQQDYTQIDVTLSVRFLSQNGAEETGEVVNVSPNGARIKSGAYMCQGDRIIAYIDQVGRVEAEMVHSAAGEFEILFKIKEARRQKIIDTLTWLAQGKEGFIQRRGAERQKQDKSAVAVYENGESVPCQVLDISITGASLHITPKPAIGQRLKIGKMSARVIRQHATGIGIIFESPYTQPS